MFLSRVYIQSYIDVSSLRTLKNELKVLGLQRRNMVADEAQVRQRIREELDGPGCLPGCKCKQNMGTYPC